MRRDVFVTGGTGYLGQPLIATLLASGHTVRALTRAGSASKLPAGAIPITGDALEEDGWVRHVAPADTFVHLIGTPHPNPSKAAEFRSIDLVSIRVAVRAAAAAGVRHFVYVSVAHPAPLMHAFIEVRKQGEALVAASGMDATILRPWYVLGPGHRWPYILLPLYAIARLLPSKREGAERLALIPRRTMIAAMAAAIDDPPPGISILEAPAIRAAAARHATAPAAGS